MMIDLVAKFQQRSDLLAAAAGEGGSVELLLDGLEPEIAHLVRICGIPHQFDPGFFQAVGISPDVAHAEQSCDELSKLPVVTFNQDGRALNDKTRRYLFEQWIGPPTSEEFQDISARLVGYFAGRAADTHGKDSENFEILKMFHLIGAEQQEGFDEFQELCREKRREFRLNDCEKLIRLVHEYDRVLSPERATLLTYHEAKLGADRCQWDQAQDLFRQVLKSQPLDPKLEIATTNRLGMIRDAERDYFGAIEYYQKALSLAGAVPDASEFVYRILGDLGAAQRDNGNLDEAEKTLKESIRLAEERNNNLGIAAGYNSLGTLYRKKQEPFEAIKAYEQSLDCLSRCQDTFRPAQVYNNLGIAYRELSKWQQSMEFFQKSLEISRQVGDTSGQAQTFNNLMVVYRNLDKNDEAVSAALQAIRLFDEVHDFYNAALTKRNLGKLYRGMKRNDEANKAFTDAIEIFLRINATDQVNDTRRDLAQLTPRGSLGFWIIVFIVMLAGILLIILITFLIGRI